MQTTKNKQFTYFLICAVAAVWSIILYRVFFNDPGEDDVVTSPSVTVKHEPYDQYLAKEDTFKLALNYKDPFLGNMAPVAVLNQGTVVTKSLNPVPAPAPKPSIDWGVIKYAGYIINPVNKKIVSIITVNGTERMLAEGAYFEGAQLLKNKKDSVLMSWKGKQKYIKQ